MNRSLRESLAGGKNVPAGSQHRRGRSLNGMYKDSDENLDLFSRNRRSLSVVSSDESDVSMKLGKISVGPVKLPKSGLDDLLSSSEGGKHDYDWLLTPPGTPLFPSSDGSESQTTTVAPRSSSLSRSASTTKASRLSVTHSESNHTSRPTRSSSVTRPSISSTQYTSYSSNRNSSILNTSSSSVSSYIRPSTPTSRSSSTARPSTPSTRPTSSPRSSTPSRVRPSPTTSTTEKPRPTQTSRPSTPVSRPQIPVNSCTPSVRSNSRPTTPTRRNSTPSLSPPVNLSTSVGRALSRNSAPPSRASSPGPRNRTPPQPIILHDFPLETPPNLRTSLPADRPVSAGRSRPGTAVMMKGNAEPTVSVSMPRRQSSPVVTRGRVTEPSGRSRVQTNGHFVDVPEPRKASHVPELAMRKPAKPSVTTTESTGFGRNISKKSLDMAIRHMDIRNGTGNIRPHSGTTLFPQSIRSSTTKSQPAHSSNGHNGGSLHSSHNSITSENTNFTTRSPDKGTNSEVDARFYAKLSDVDIYESSRYDAILLHEDLKNTNWLHSVDDKTEIIFDNGFEPPPEPFGLYNL